MKPAPITSLLWRSQRTYQIFGANTDVGKTIFSTLLCKGTKKLWRDSKVTFLKPVSTGPESEADTRCELHTPLPIFPHYRTLYRHENEKQSWLVHELTASEPQMHYLIFP